MRMFVKLTDCRGRERIVNVQAISHTSFTPYPRLSMTNGEFIEIDDDELKNLEAALLRLDPTR